MKKNSLLKILSVVALAGVLTACDEDIVNLPSDKGNSVFAVEGDTNKDVTDNTREHVYDNITKTTTTASKTLDNLLYAWAKTELSQKTNPDFPLTDEEFEAEFTERWHKEMVDAARTSTYATDNVFSEYRYAQSLTTQLYDIGIKQSDGSVKKRADFDSTEAYMAALRSAANKQVVTPDMEYEDIFALDYSDYVERHFRPEIYKHYLNAYYVYSQSYSSIGATAARDITAIALTDSTDEPGLAGRFMAKFKAAYIDDTSASLEAADLHHLERLYKGIGSKEEWENVSSDSALASSIKKVYGIADSEEMTLGKFVDEHHFYPLNETDIAWYTGTFGTNSDKLVTSDGLPDTLVQGVYEDVKKITDNEYTTDDTLESKYTNSDAYSVEWGVELALRSIAQETFITEGVTLKDSGISSYPSSLTNRVFENNYSNDINGVALRTVSNDNSYIVHSGTTAEDVSCFTHTDSNLLRYVTPRTMENDEDIVSYDSSSKKYFLVQINADEKLSSDATRDTSRIVTASRLRQNSSDSAEVKNFKADLALDTAYEMTKSDSYTKQAVTYYFTHKHVSYSDPDFYDYMKSNYPDCFDSDGMPVYND